MGFPLLDSGLLGGGGGGGLQSGVNALVAGGAAAISTAEANRLAARERRRIREGIQQGVGQSQAETFQILNDPGFVASQDFVRGLFGIAPAAAGPFGASTSIGGLDFFGAPPATGLSRRVRREGKVLGKEISQVLRAERALETGAEFRKISPGGGGFFEDVTGQFSGFDVTGTAGDVITRREQKAGVDIRTVGEKRAGKLQQRLSPEAVDQLLSVFVANPAQRTMAIEELRRQGFQPEDLIGLAQTVGLSEEDIGLEAGAFTPPAPGEAGAFLDPLTANFLQGAQQAGVGTGLEGFAPAAAQAAGLGAFRTNLQLGLIPQLAGFAQAPSQIFQGLLPGNLQLGVQQRTGGTATFGVARPDLLNQSVFGNAALAGAGAFLSSGGGGGF